jgi:hypothetical protein
MLYNTATSFNVLDIQTMCTYNGFNTVKAEAELLVVVHHHSLGVPSWSHYVLDTTFN